MVALWLVLPLGVVSVKLTAAPESGVPPFVTEAVMVTVPGGVKLDPETEAVAAIAGAVMTVAFAVPDVFVEVVAAVKFTAYVPAAVPLGAPFLMDNAKDCPGVKVTEDDESDVDQPDGSVEFRLIVLEEHPDESLSVSCTE